MFLFIFSINDTYIFIEMFFIVFKMFIFYDLNTCNALNYTESLQQEMGGKYI